MKKRLPVILLCLALLLTLFAACGNGQTKSTPPAESVTETEAPAPETEALDEPDPTQAAVPNVLDERTVKVAVLDNMWSDRSADAMKAAGSYLEENFNCKFEYITIDDASAQAVIAGTENAITMGCEIVISCIAEGLEQSTSICQDAGATFSYLNCNPRNEELEIIKKYDNYAATVCPPLDGYAVGYDLAGKLIEEGRDNFAIVTFTQGLLNFVDQQTAGFTARCEEEGANIVYTLEEMPGPSMITAVSTMLETYSSDIEYIVAYGGGTNFVVPALTALNLTIPLAVPSIPTDYETYFNAGILDYVLAFSDDGLTLAFAMGINYLNGAPVNGMPDDKTIETCFAELRSLDDLKTYDEISQGLDSRGPTFTADEIRSIITAYNPNATYEDVLALAQSVDLEGIIARHS